MSSGSTALLFSGGVESTCLAYGFRPDLLIFVDYGQISARGERDAVLSFSDSLNIPVKILKTKMGSKPKSIMTGSAEFLPGNEFWPFRNQHLITVAASYLHNKEFSKLWIGTVARDRRFKDGTMAFVRQIRKLVQLQSPGVVVDAPAIKLSTEKLIIKTRLPINFLSRTFSCHAGSISCGQCPGCVKNHRLLHWLLSR